MFDLESIDYCEAVRLQSTFEIPVEFWCWAKCLISNLIPGLCMCGEELGDWLLCFYSGFIVIVSLSTATILASKEAVIWSSDRRYSHDQKCC